MAVKVAFRYEHFVSTKRKPILRKEVIEAMRAALPLSEYGRKAFAEYEIKAILREWPNIVRERGIIAMGHADDSRILLPSNRSMVLALLRFWDGRDVTIVEGTIEVLTGNAPVRPREHYLRRYPRICAHIIAESLGYATPEVAAQILKDGAEGRPNFCEWIDACWSRDATACVRQAIANRHRHEGVMAHYPKAKAIVDEVNRGAEGPIFASWF